MLVTDSKFGFHGNFQALAQDITNDTVTTPFRKGRWLSGLNGSFSSSTLKLESSEGPVTANSYGLEIFTGTFFKNRWFIGFNLSASSSRSAGFIDKESENLIIGPSVNYYFLKEAHGSLYVSALPGYIRIRETGSVDVDNNAEAELAQGVGFATRLRLGYSYVISKRIILDVGVGTNLSWLDVTYDSNVLANSRKESVFSNTTLFSFGFNVLLDEFFF